MRFDFLDLNGKDIAEDRQRTEELTFGLGQRLGKPWWPAATPIRRCSMAAFAPVLNTTLLPLTRWPGR